MAAAAAAPPPSIGRAKPAGLLGDLSPDEPSDACCWACSGGGDVMCCDGCRAVFHTACMGYGEQVPEDDWWCPLCTCSACGDPVKGPAPAVPGCAARFVPAAPLRPLRPRGAADNSAHHERVPHGPGYLCPQRLRRWCAREPLGDAAGGDDGDDKEDAAAAAADAAPDAATAAAAGSSPAAAGALPGGAEPAAKRQRTEGGAASSSSGSVSLSEAASYVRCCCCQAACHLACLPVELRAAYVAAAEAAAAAGAGAAAAAAAPETPAPAAATPAPPEGGGDDEDDGGGGGGAAASKRSGGGGRSTGRAAKAKAAAAIAGKPATAAGKGSAGKGSAGKASGGKRKGGANAGDGEAAAAPAAAPAAPAGPPPPYFCSPNCERVAAALAARCALGAVPFEVLADGTPIAWQLVQPAAVAAALAEEGPEAAAPRLLGSGVAPGFTTQQAKVLAQALRDACALLEAELGPGWEVRSGDDVLPWLVAGLRQPTPGGLLDASCAHVALLWVGGTLAAAALARMHGPAVLEVAAVAVAGPLQHRALGRALVGQVERFALEACGARQAFMPSLGGAVRPCVGVSLLPTGWPEPPPPARRPLQVDARSSVALLGLAGAGAKPEEHVAGGDPAPAAAAAQQQQQQQQQQQGLQSCWALRLRYSSGGSVADWAQVPAHDLVRYAYVPFVLKRLGYDSLTPPPRYRRPPRPSHQQQPQQPQQAAPPPLDGGAAAPAVGAAGAGSGAPSPAAAGAVAPLLTGSDGPAAEAAAAAPPEPSPGGGAAGADDSRAAFKAEMARRFLAQNVAMAAAAAAAAGGGGGAGASAEAPPQQQQQQQQQQEQGAAEGGGAAQEEAAAANGDGGDEAAAEPMDADG